METRVLELGAWLAAQPQTRAENPQLGHWAHTFLALAKKLARKGILSSKLEPAPRWQGKRLLRGEMVAPLSERQREWLIDQARLLAEMKRAGRDLDCARYFVDHLIWFWTADGCHPRSEAVRRDAVKHDHRHIWWSYEARKAIDTARSQGKRISSVVQHEHAVPKKELVNLILGGQLESRAVLERFARAVLVTKEEHLKLNKHFKVGMPGDWDPLNPQADPFARYNHPLVAIKPNPPLTEQQAG